MLEKKKKTGSKEKKQEWTWNISGHQSWITLNLHSLYCSLLSAEVVISGKLHFRRKNWEVQSQHNTLLRWTEILLWNRKAIPVCNVTWLYELFLFIIIKLLGHKKGNLFCCGNSILMLKFAVDSTVFDLNASSLSHWQYSKPNVSQGPSRGWLGLPGVGCTSRIKTGARVPNWNDLSEEVQMSMLISDKWTVEETSSNCLWFHHQ